MSHEVELHEDCVCCQTLLILYNLLYIYILTGVLLFEVPLNTIAGVLLGVHTLLMAA